MVVRRTNYAGADGPHGAIADPLHVVPGNDIRAGLVDHHASPETTRRDGSRVTTLRDE